jgi:7-cyano-7-deazaguanine reductase
MARRLPPRQRRITNDPRTPDEARLLLRQEAFPAPDVQEVTFDATEFTSLCPLSGRPDFGSVLITYTPGRRCLESRALKLYMVSFRNEPAFCETLAGRIADDIMFAIRPRRLRVQVRQNVRGGIALFATAERGSRSRR